MTNLPPVDWQRLEFTCSHEADRLPKPDQQADEWYVRANELYKYGIKRDDDIALKQSVELLMKASERGHVKAMNNLSKSFLDGDGIAQSDAKAVEWVEELIKRNIGMGYYQMGVFLQQGIGVKQDRKAALTYFRKAADLGNAQGQVVSGKKISEAVAQSSAEEKERGFAIGRAMLTCALEQGLAEAGYELGFQYAGFEKKPVEALQAFQAAAKLGHHQSLWTLHTIFEVGDYGVAKDQRRAACYKRLSDESDEDKTKKFPNINIICPLPPQKMPGT